MFQDVFISCGNILYVYGRLVSQNDLSSRFFTRGSCMVRKINCLVWSLDLLAYSKLRWLFSLEKLFTNLKGSRVVTLALSNMLLIHLHQIECANFVENVATLKKIKDIIGSSSYVRLVA